MSKLIVVVGITGNQGGSVAHRFLQDSNYRVRGVTRNPEAPKAKEFATRGVEIVQADLDEAKSLKKAFNKANVIFAVTNYWEPFFRPDCRQEAQEAGISCREHASHVEYRHGKNIADAAATEVDTLLPNGFLVSTLSHAGKCSKGAFKELYHFDAKADIFPDYVGSKHPGLASKMSCIQTGYFFTSYRLIPDLYLKKLSDGSFQMSLTTNPDKPAPHLDVVADMGNFVYAVSHRSPGGHYMAEGSTCSWSDWVRIWGEITDQKASYRHVTPRQMIDMAPDKEFGREVAEMFMYTSNPGYDGGMELITAADMRKEGIDCPMTSLEDFVRKTDWTDILSQ
ncbi:uncharacterized protein A1O9_03980 [Exophiala aquamarina CBS 119918]|uniref:NmrA-like domain-containing protein n=1 Tax=Exophiala aquamarina CBS 119918 TaxID=1182545 RepID=A0A072PGZ1_9EURO|nr:uncharacterized protein A1O9_03980 [Exophiala aquamarina CBS 119918]KEF59136.1 hypothetical protein A1O9_03980 [Exophiala aquamarina CBS 119918]